MALASVLILSQSQKDEPIPRMFMSGQPIRGVAWNTPETLYDLRLQEDRKCSLQLNLGDEGPGSPLRSPSRRGSVAGTPAGSRRGSEAGTPSSASSAAGASEAGRGRAIDAKAEAERERGGRASFDPKAGNDVLIQRISSK